MELTSQLINFIETCIILWFLFYNSKPSLHHNELENMDNHGFMGIHLLNIELSIFIQKISSNNQIIQHLMEPWTWKKMLTQLGISNFVN